MTKIMFAADDWFKRIAEMMNSGFFGFGETGVDLFPQFPGLAEAPEGSFTSHSISYSYNSQDPQPRVVIDGKELHPEEIEQMMAEGRMPALFGGMGSATDAPELTISPPHEIPAAPGIPETQGTEDPYTDLHETEGGATAYLEMPGVTGEDLVIDYEGRTVKVTGYGPHTMYIKTLVLGFEPDPKETTAAANNGIVSLKFIPA
jgi:HSP20 family molecular chaperone IbpA